MEREERELYEKLSSILREYPAIDQFLSKDFLRKQCISGLSSYILKHVAQKDTKDNSQYLDSLENQLARLENVPGFGELRKGLRSSNWEQYYEARTQIDTSVWFSQRGMLKEIEPDLLHRTGSCDLLISLEQNDIYCEVTSRRFSEANSAKALERMQKVQKKQPWLTPGDVVSQQQIDYVLQSLRYKAKHQLPPCSPGILVLETGRDGLYRQHIIELANKLFTDKSQAPIPQVILIMLWSLERGSNIGEAPFWFINRNSQFKNVGTELIKHLKQEDKAIDCG